MEKIKLLFLIFILTIFTFHEWSHEEPVLVSQLKEYLLQGYTLCDLHCGGKEGEVDGPTREWWMLQTKQCLPLHLHLFLVWCTWSFLLGIWDERILWPHANEQLARSPRQSCEHDVEWLWRNRTGRSLKNCAHLWLRHFHRPCVAPESVSSLVESVPWWNCWFLASVQCNESMQVLVHLEEVGHGRECVCVPVQWFCRKPFSSEPLALGCSLHVSSVGSPYLRRSFLVAATFFDAFLKKSDIVDETGSDFVWLWKTVDVECARCIVLRTILGGGKDFKAVYAGKDRLESHWYGDRCHDSAWIRPWKNHLLPWGEMFCNCRKQIYLFRRQLKS